MRENRHSGYEPEPNWLDGEPFVETENGTIDATDGLLVQFRMTKERDLIGTGRGSSLRRCATSQRRAGWCEDLEYRTRAVPLISGDITAAMFDQSSDRCPRTSVDTWPADGRCGPPLSHVVFLWAHCGVQTFLVHSVITD